MGQTAGMDLLCDLSWRTHFLHGYAEPWVCSALSRQVVLISSHRPQLHFYFKINDAHYHTGRAPSRPYSHENVPECYAAERDDKLASGTSDGMNLRIQF